MHEAVTCMQPIYGIECMRGEGACVLNMQVVTVFYDQKNLGVGATYLLLPPGIKWLAYYVRTNVLIYFNVPLNSTAFVEKYGKKGEH